MKHGIVGQCSVPCLGSALCIDYVLGGGELVEKVCRLIQIYGIK